MDIEQEIKEIKERIEKIEKCLNIQSEIAITRELIEETYKQTSKLIEDAYKGIRKEIPKLFNKIQ